MCVHVCVCVCVCEGECVRVCVCVCMCVCVCVLSKERQIHEPASCKACTAGAEVVGMWEKEGQAAVVGHPATSTLSFTAKGTPHRALEARCRGGRPSRTRAASNRASRGASEMKMLLLDCASDGYRERSSSEGVSAPVSNAACRAWRSIDSRRRRGLCKY